ncbi:unnamed protein product [Didymodactylos carnosus]|uniref:Uncharacterized protein n=1 Tax=Didymodactylos carnosus TaxID=1234261 RepID=A0A8S2E4Z6_9BILA|nr:unnamed protein product [Didymodactylos carnosus]CAF3904457.1 unnamed protein product [Didymodactylos carnosus]
MVAVKILRLGYSYSFLIPTADTDGDTVRCRWAASSVSVPGGTLDECSGICQTFPGSYLNNTACTMSYTATSVGLWAVALMMEDFEFSWSTTPL